MYLLYFSFFILSTTKAKLSCLGLQRKKENLTRQKSLLKSKRERKAGSSSMVICGKRKKRKQRRGHLTSLTEGKRYHK
jgi:hypothetical protein